MVLMNNMELPVSAIRNYIEKAIDLVIQIDRLYDGKRKVTSISEVVGFDCDNLKLKEIFSFTEEGISNNGEVIGAFKQYKYIAHVYEKIKRKGIKLESIFGE